MVQPNILPEKYHRLYRKYNIRPTDPAPKEVKCNLIWLNFLPKQLNSSVKQVNTLTRGPLSDLYPAFSLPQH